MTPSMHSALENLRLRRLFVVHAGTEVYPLAKNVLAVPLARMREEVDRLP
jgi:hypothetical protein